MKRSKSYLTAAILILLLASAAGAAKYAGEPYALGVGGRALAMGGAAVAGPFDASAPYWNPAGMNQLEGRSIVAMHSETFGSLLNHDFFAYVDARPESRSWLQSFGFYFYRLGGGGIKITSLDGNNRPQVDREESHGDIVLAAAIGGKLIENLEYGLTVKYLNRDLATETGHGFSVDGGLLYPLAPYAELGLTIADLTTGFIRYSGDTFGEATTESISPSIKPGFMLYRDYYQFTGRFTASADISLEDRQISDQYHTGLASANTHFGWEVEYQQSLFARLGLDAGNFTAGVGLASNGASFDFAFQNHSDLDESYRVSAAYSF